MITSVSEAQAVIPTPRPYPPSWVDRLQLALERLPLPLWSFYLGLWLLPFGLMTGIKWWDGSYALGSLSITHAAQWGTAVLALALMHYLDHSAAVSLRAFRPALEVSEADYAHLHYRLTNLPAKKAMLAAVIGAAMGPAELLTLGEDAIRASRIFTSLPAAGVEVVLYTLGWAIWVTFLYHTIHQLRLVSHIYACCTQVNLFRLDPLYSFSWLTARTALGIALIPYLFLLATSTVYTIQPRWLALILVFIAIATVVFVWPLWGIHRVLEREKHKLLREASMQLEAAIKDLHASANARDLGVMDALNKLISSLTLEQVVLEKISTWPWRPDTARFLATALLLPLVVYLGQRALALILGL